MADRAGERKYYRVCRFARSTLKFPGSGGRKLRCGFASSHRNPKTIIPISRGGPEAKAAWSGCRTNLPWAVHHSSLRLCRGPLTHFPAAGKLAAATAWPTRRDFSSGTCNTIFEAASGNSVFNT